MNPAAKTGRSREASKERASARRSILAPFALAATLAAASAAACASADNDGSDSDGGGLFSPDAPTGPSPDDGGSTGPDAEPCPTEPCDLFEQCGCGEGEACDIDRDDNSQNMCREIAGTSGRAASCDGSLTECRAGYVCIAGEPSFCRGYCQSDDDCSGDGAHCRINLGPRDDVACTFHCNAALLGGGGACPEARPGCYFVPNDDGYHTRCLEPGPGSHGDPCDTRTDCDEAHTCLFFDGEGECRRICVIGEGGCGDGFECSPISSRPRIGTREYGHCASE